ncbi:GumC family protein [Desulfoluna spongiiphila]|uniref:non-specific protein-tyrosine kinase n=1 Tax=Desulfoluna spongiiphila TaxID=419481 RepID=A0A1G5IDI2_9BACT|nr:polysaccharide biosynthesis tyrosine autokinase [Desulfoluna spongiiphila]SCY73821.1 capsular exopolysaccharide family [Desulfoluna spongiiphila]
MEEREIHLRDYWRVIQKRRLTVLTFFILTLTLTVIGVFTSNLEPTWQATSRLLIEKNDSSSSIIESQGYVRWDPQFLETQFQIIRSKPVAVKVVENLDLATRYGSWFLDPDEEKGSIWEDSIAWVRDMLDSFSATEGQGDGPVGVAITDVDIIANALIEELKIKPTKDSKIVNISYEFDNPVIASMVVNAFTRAYMDELLEMRMKATGYTVEWMSKKAEEQRKQLETAEKSLNAYMRQQDIVAIENNINIGPQRVNELSAKMTVEETRKEELRAISERLRTVTNEQALAVPAVSDDEAIQDIRRDLVKAEQTILEYSKKYGRKHPVMIRSTNELDLLQGKLTTETQRVIQSIQNNYEMARENVKNLKSQLLAAKSEAITLSEKYVQYKILKRDVETYRHLYNALIAKIKEQTLSEEVQTVSVWTVEAAVPPVEPVDTHRARNLLLGVLLGLFGGVGLAFFVEYLDNTVKSVEEAEERFGLPVLSVISQMDAKEGRIEDVLKVAPLSSVSESYKSLRVALMLTSRDTPPRRILFTSMAPADGKSTTAVNLATALANSGKKVLIIDGDLRKPNLGNLLGLTSEVGLSTYLSGNSDDSVVINTDVENLHAALAGPVPPLPSELLSSERLKTFLDAMSEIYDMVVIDSPPVMPVSDSLILSQLVDTTVVVVRAGKTSYDMLDRGLKAMEHVGADVKGLVINGAGKKNGGYYYYGYGAYYGGYAYGDSERQKACG